MNVAITGSTGFLGKHVIGQLHKANIQFAAFEKGKHNLHNPDTLREFVSGKDDIIHLAGANRGDAYELIKTNVLGTIGLLAAMRKYNRNARIIFASSFQAYVENSLYGLSKRLAEKEIAFYTSRFGLRATILRISNIYGPGCKPFYNSVIATFAYQAKRGKTIQVNGKGDQKRDFVYVDDVVEALIKVVHFGQKTPIEYFDICIGEQVSVKKMLSIMGKISSQKIKVEYSKIEEKPWMVMKSYARAKKELNWEPKVTIHEGLRRTLESFNENS